MGVIGVLGALHNRERTGERQLVEMSLYETALGWTPYRIMSYLATGEVPPELGADTREVLREIDGLLAEGAVADDRLASSRDS